MVKRSVSQTQNKTNRRIIHAEEKRETIGDKKKESMRAKKMKINNFNRLFHFVQARKCMILHFNDYDCPGSYKSKTIHDFAL